MKQLALLNILIIKIYQRRSKQKRNSHMMFRTETAQTIPYLSGLQRRKQTDYQADIVENMNGKKVLKNLCSYSNQQQAIQWSQKKKVNVVQKRRLLILHNLQYKFYAPNESYYCENCTKQGLINFSATGIPRLTRFQSTRSSI